MVVSEASEVSEASGASDVLGVGFFVRVVSLVPTGTPMSQSACQQTEFRSVTTPNASAQPVNASRPTVQAPGRVSTGRETQSRNASAPTEVSDCPNDTLESSLQPENARTPTDVTPSGRVSHSSPAHSLKQ